MTAPSQAKAVKNYRRRLKRAGLARYEVLGLDADRALLRDVARRLAAGDAASASLRRTVARGLAPEIARKGGILAALRRSPLATADLDLRRDKATVRRVDL